MPLYPLPVILAIIVWAGVFLSTGRNFAFSGLAVISLGIIAYFLAKNTNCFSNRKFSRKKTKLTKFCHKNRCVLVLKISELSFKILVESEFVS